MKNLMIIATCATMLLGSGASAFAKNCAAGQPKGINRGHHHVHHTQHAHRFHHRRGR